MRDAESLHGSSKPHAINLRVMRLVEPLPTITTSPLVNHEKPFTESPLWDKEGAPCGIGTLSVLPSSFGAVYGSEVFCSLISVFNRTTSPVKITSLTVDLQTSSMRSISLLRIQDTIILESKRNVNKVVRVSLGEIGTHVLTCATTYDDIDSPRTLRQFFRFNILPPNAPTQTANMLCQSMYNHHDRNYFTSASFYSLIELRIVNNTETPVYVHGTKFFPRAPFRFYPCIRNKQSCQKETSGDNHDRTVENDRYATINKGDICTVAFQVHWNKSAEKVEADSSTSADHVEDTSVDNSGDGNLAYIVDGTAMSSPSLMTLRDPEVFKQHDFGRVEVSWRSTLGEKGILRTAIMMSEPRPRQNMVDVCITAVPRRVYVHRTFTARCQVRNNSDKTVRLYLQVRRDLVGDIVPVGVSGISLGSVYTGQKTSCAIPMIPLAKGLHSLSGFRVIDVESNAIYKARAAPITVL